MHLAFAAYCPASEVNSWSCGEHCKATTGISLPQYVFHGGKQLAAYVAWDSQARSVLLVFRGTTNDSVSTAIKNWAVNLDFCKIQPFDSHPDVEVHGGFWNAWQSLKTQIVPRVAGLLKAHNANTVRVVGHSLGGAMATNAAVDLKMEHGWSTSVINFGSPRVGDINYQELIKTTVPFWRVTHDADLVVHVPPQWAGFYHGSTEIFFQDDYHYKVCDGSGEDHHCSDSCSSGLLPSCTSIDDHLNMLGMGMSCSSGMVVV